MAGANFDILFAGELVGDADPDEVRRQLQQRFKLSDESLARLFSGKTVSIKRGVDTATASNYRQIFRDAGALVQIRPVETSDTASGNPDSGPATEGPQREATEAGGSAGAAPFPEAPEIDISHLSLVPGKDWTLEDCQPPPEPTKLPDTSHLELVIPDTELEDSTG